MGRIVQTQLKPLVQLRKNEYASYENEVPGNQVSATRPVHFTQSFNSTETWDSNRTEFSGIGCYQGTVIAPVSLVFSAQDDLNLEGKILCTLRTDPGWAPLFPIIKGLIVERGSTLSHSAIVARELGIPTVVGVANITKIIQDGELVELNGLTGTIKRLGTNHSEVAS